MKFTEKYKDVPVMELGDNTYLRSTTEHPCCVCGSHTPFIEINYEAPFCSEECERVFYPGNTKKNDPKIIIHKGDLS